MTLTSFIRSSILGAALFGLAACNGSDSNAPLLTAHIDGAEGADLVFAYSLSGDLLDTKYERVELDSLGNFEFRPDSLPAGFTDTDATLYVNDEQIGAFLQKGKTSELNITILPEGAGVKVEYAGDNADVSEFLTAYDNAFDFMKYFSMDENDTTTNAQYRDLLDANYASVKDALENVKSSKIRDQYAAFADAKYMAQTLSLLRDKAYYEKFDVRQDPEYIALIEKIDPNDEIAGRTNLFNHWLMAHNTAEADGSGFSPRSIIAEVNLIDTAITYAPNRRRALNMSANSFFTYAKPTPEEAEAFMADFTRAAADYPDLIDRCSAEAKKVMESVQPGDPMPCDPELQAPDGSTIKLSSLYGKVIYIDVWATWCGPCQREIPKFAEAYERFKGKPIQFVSISVDQDQDAWLAQLKRENPAWPQYRLTPEENKKFSEALAITGIPRFIIIGADGKLIAPDAARPSDPNIDEVLNNTL